MSYFKLTTRTALLVLSIITLPCLSFAAKAEVQKITGVVVDADSRIKLDNVGIELLDNGESIQKHTSNSNVPFSVEYDFKEDGQYKLLFTRADYYPYEIDLSNALANGFMPKQMTVSLSGDQSSFFFWGLAVNRETGEGIRNIKFSTTNLMTGEKVISSTDQQGKYQLNIAPGYEYEVTIQSKDHLKRFATINYCNDTLEPSNKYCFSGFNDVTLNEQGGVSGSLLVLDKIEIGKKFKVDNIYYEYNKATIKKSALPNLRKVQYILEDNPQITIELASHADSRGSDTYNLQLSERRAQAAVVYVIDQGVEESRIISKGYGETQLINHCKNGVACSDKEHADNRRTEFTIIGIDPSYMIDP